jgi:hypothetical protein
MKNGRLRERLSGSYFSSLNGSERRMGCAKVSNNATIYIAITLIPENKHVLRLQKGFQGKTAFFFFRRPYNRFSL